MEATSRGGEPAEVIVEAGARILTSRPSRQGSAVVETRTCRGLVGGKVFVSRIQDGVDGRLSPVRKVVGNAVSDAEARAVLEAVAREPLPFHDLSVGEADPVRFLEIVSEVEDPAFVWLDVPPGHGSQVRSLGADYDQIRRCWFSTSDVDTGLVSRPKPVWRMLVGEGKLSKETAAVVGGRWDGGGTWFVDVSVVDPRVLSDFCRDNGFEVGEREEVLRVAQACGITAVPGLPSA